MIHARLLLPCPPPQVHQGGVPLLRLRFDPAASDVDPRYYQYVRGLWNITSPTAGACHCWRVLPVAGWRLVQLLPPALQCGWGRLLRS